MQQRTNSSNAIQLVLVLGVLFLLAQLFRQVLPTTNLMPYIVVSLLSILALIVKSRFR